MSSMPKIHGIRDQGAESPFPWVLLGVRLQRGDREQNQPTVLIEGI